MNKTIALIAAALLLSLCLSAAAESPLDAVINAAEKLAFETDNVTITGKADFLLDGERFKTADITYVQDGENSLWREKLLTPGWWRPDSESGFTVIQNGNSIYVTETLHPGLYRQGNDEADRFLLRRSPMTELLLAMARSAAARLGASSGSAIASVGREDGTREIRLELDEASAPDIVSFAANLGLRLAGSRLFGISGDTGTILVPVVQMYMYPKTDTQRILCETGDLVFCGASVRIGMDPSGRLVSAAGDLSVRLTFRPGEEDELPEDGEGAGNRERVLTVRFDAAVSRYGESSVAPFDPAGLRAVSRETMFVDDLHWPDEGKALTPEQAAQLGQRGRELCRAAGIDAGAQTEIGLDDGRVSLCFETNHGLCDLTMTEDGLLLSLDLEEGGFNGADTEEACPDALKQPILDFLRTANPRLDLQDLRVIEKLDDGESSFIYVIGTAEDGKYTDTLLSVRLNPAWRIEEYTCLGHG